MTTLELVAKVKNALEVHGFNVFDTPWGKSDMYEANGRITVTKDSKAYFTKTDYGVYHWNGFSIGTEIVHRHNGTAENVSVDAIIYTFKNSSGHGLDKQRFNTGMSEKQIQSRVSKLAASWNELTK